MITAVWLVRSHQIAADLRYWLTYIGYDKRDHSLSHKVYLAYATLFFCGWIFATLALLADLGGGLLGGFGLPLDLAAAAVLTLVLLAWGINQAYQAGRASPLTFTEDDAALICQTPVSRPAVALFWLLGAWIKQGPLFWALSVALAFAVQDAQLGTAVSVEFVPRYVLAGLRALLVALLLQTGWMALAWAWGALRLRGERAPRYWWIWPLALSMALGGLLLAESAQHPADFPLGGVLRPLAFPALAGYGLADGPAGLLAGLLWALAGLVVLGYAARGMNLGRAAQETNGRAAAEAAALTGNAQVAAEITLRRRLGTGHDPSRLPGRPGSFALLWKSALAYDRRGVGGLLGVSLIILVSGLAIVLAPDWGSRAWAVLAWLVAVQQLSAAPLQDDLRMWILFRGLPLSPRGSLLSGLALPAALTLLLGLLALAARFFVPLGDLEAWALLLLPGAVLSCGLAAAVDVLRSARSGRLLTGSAPAPGTTGVLLGGVVCALSALAVWFMGGGPLGYASAAAISLGLAYLLLQWAQEALTNIE